MTADFEDCVVAILTSSGRAAIASIGIAGSNAARLVEKFFHSQVGSLDSAPANRVFFGRWEREGAHEEVVVCHRGEWIEVHSHGGQAAAPAIVRDLVARGAREIDWRSWIKRHSFDTIQAEASIALPEALTLRCAEILLDQQAGALRAAVQRMEALVQQGDIQGALALVRELLQRGRLGLHLTQPFRVALVGAANVGKSSLVNRLLGYQRSIVYEQPGTTRDIVSAVTAFDGWPVELLDTAGLRETGDSVEAAGVEQARHTAGEADLVLWIAAADVSWPCSQFAESDTKSAVIRVLNKADLLSAECGVYEGWLPASALTGLGLDQLIRAIVNHLVPKAPAAGEPVPFSRRQLSLLQEMFVPLAAVAEKTRAEGATDQQWIDDMCNDIVQQLLYGDL